MISLVISALKVALRSFTSILRFNNALKYAFQINNKCTIVITLTYASQNNGFSTNLSSHFKANFAAQPFVNIARPFLGNILEKYEIYGTRSELWKSALLRKIPKDQLPPHYGGNKYWNLFFSFKIHVRGILYFVINDVLAFVLMQMISDLTNLEEISVCPNVLCTHSIATVASFP